MTEVGRRLVGPPLIEAYGSHDSVDRQNGEQDPFVKSVQTPFLQRCLRRKSQRRYQASQEEGDCSEQGQEPARAVRPFRVFLTQILIIEKPFFFQQYEFLEERLDKFGEFQLGGGLRLKLDRAECISDHIGGHGSRGSCYG